LRGKHEKMKRDGRRARKGNGDCGFVLGGMTS